MYKAIRRFIRRDHVEPVQRVALDGESWAYLADSPDPSGAGFIVAVLLVIVGTERDPAQSATLTKDSNLPESCLHSRSDEAVDRLAVLPSSVA